MTRERRLAIEMWEFIIEHFDENSVWKLKEAFADMHPEISWKNDCWFCEYARRDYRPHHPGRKHIAHTSNGCQDCPLYEYEIAHGNYFNRENACGCAVEDWGLSPLFARAQFDNDKRAAELILKILKNEKL